jgi:hypothetical protein
MEQGTNTRQITFVTEALEETADSMFSTIKDKASMSSSK